MIARVPALLLITLLVGCSSGGGCGSEPSAPAPAPAPAPAAAATPDPPPETKAAALMADHYAKAYEAREALIRADLDAAKPAMKFLAEHQRGDALPEELRPLLADMQRAAGAFAEATTLRAAGEALSGTFARCGVCHKQAGKGPTIASAPVPEPGTDGVSHMKRHHWATQAMWEGLVTASDERYAEGAKALDEASLPGEALAAGGAQAKDVARLDAHIHGLAKQALAATDLRGRAEAYARLLATCATCHKLLQRGPQPVGEVEAIP